MAQIIYTSQMPELIAQLKKLGRVVAPVVRHAHSGASKVIFDEFEAGDALDLDYPVTVSPPKEFFLPPVERLLEFEDGEAQLPEVKTTVVFGVSYEDLEGLARLQKIFASPVTDEAFAARAKKTIVIAADKYSPPKHFPFDVYLQKISSDRYAAFAGTALGQKIIKNGLFQTEPVSVPRVQKKPDPLLENKLLREALKKSQGSRIWSDLAERCFACGVCSFACPLCYCFETEDRIDLAEGKKIKGQRVRKWSTCFSEDFAATAGHNFRAERADRIYNWYYHKFVRMPKEYGFSGCVDCNRCVVFCPAKINYRTVLAEVITEYGQGEKK